MVRSNLKKSWDFYQGTSVGAGSPKALWLGGGGEWKGQVKPALTLVPSFARPLSGQIKLKNC
jgi:hypothetical protein